MKIRTKTCFAGETAGRRGEGRRGPLRFLFSRRQWSAAVGWGLLLAAFVVAMPPQAGAKPEPRLPLLPRDGVVLAFGDSITYGIGAVYDENYPAVLERLIGRKVINAGVPGELSSHGLRRLAQILGRLRPDMVIICHGGNDLIHGVDERLVAANIRAMVRLAKERGASVILVAVPRITAGKISPSPPFYRQIAAESGVPYAGDVLKTILENRAHRADVFHPNALGYRELAESLAHLMQMSGAF